MTCKFTEKRVSSQLLLKILTYIIRTPVSRNSFHSQSSNFCLFGSEVCFAINVKKASSEDCYFVTRLSVSNSKKYNILEAYEQERKFIYFAFTTLVTFKFGELLNFWQFFWQFWQLIPSNVLVCCKNVTTKSCKKEKQSFSVVTIISQLYLELFSWNTQMMDC